MTTYSIHLYQGSISYSAKRYNTHDYNTNWNTPILESVHADNTDFILFTIGLLL